MIDKVWNSLSGRRWPNRSLESTKVYFHDWDIKLPELKIENTFRKHNQIFVNLFLAQSLILHVSWVQKEII